MNHNDWLPFLRTIRREKLILRKRTGFLLFITLVILFSATSLAEYEQYRLTEPYELYTGPYTTVYPIDSHNVIVRMAPPEAVPWRVEWYQDGRVIRTLEASGDYDSVSPAIPIFETDGSITMLCRIPGADQETEKYPPLNAKAQWTDSGLSYITPMAEHLLAARCGNRIAFYETDQYVRISCNGKDTIVSRELADTFRIKTTKTSCIALADEVFLIPTRRDGLLCLDRGRIRYKLDESFYGWEMLPDGRQGFFSCAWDYVDWSSDRAVTPVRMTHFDGNGQLDRTYLLQGNHVAITPSQVYISPNGKSIILYGSAADPSGGAPAVFAMTLDENMSATNLDVWNIDPDYAGYEAKICLAPGGYPYVYLYRLDQQGSVQPAVVPFSMLEKSENDYDISLK